jgi:hypothetical protein
VLTSILVSFALFASGDPPTDDKSDNKGKIEGTKWSSLAATVRGQTVPAGTLKLEFAKDGKLVYNTPLGTFNGTYELGAGPKVTLKLDKELAGSKKHEETVVIKDGKLTMSDSDGTSMTFEKAKPADDKKPDDKKDKTESNNKGKIEGKWSSVASKIKDQNIPAGTLKLEFTKDGKLTYETPLGTYTGTYELGAGDKVTLKLDKELAGTKTHEESVVVKDDKLTMTDKDGTAMTFEKVKK